MRLISAHFAFALATTVAALVVRDDPFNVTSVAISTPVSPPSNTEVAEPSSTSKKECPICRPKPEISVTGGFDDRSDATTQGNDPTPVPAPPPGIGDLIKSFLTVSTSLAINTERPSNGFDQESQPPQPSRTGILHPPHLEAPAPSAGFVQATTASNAPDDRPRVTPPPTRPLTSPPPEVTLGEITLRPTPVTSAQVVTVDGKPTTTNVVVFQYVVGSSTIIAGTTATINGIPVAVNIKADGQTVVVANDKTTTLPPPVPNMVVVQATDGAQVAISTLVQDGTTKYVLGGQTLAPGHAITVNNVPISFTTKEGATILVMGDVTTTLVASTSSSAGLGTSAVSTPSYGRTVPTTTSVKSGAGPARGIHPIFAQSVEFVRWMLHLG